MRGWPHSGYNGVMSIHGTVVAQRRSRVFGSILVLSCIVSDVAVARTVVEPALLSHRAVYGLPQHIGSASSDITAVQGRLEITFEVACDGWRIEQYIGFRLYHAEGAGLEHVARLSGWESKKSMQRIAAGI